MICMNARDENISINIIVIYFYGKLDTKITKCSDSGLVSYHKSEILSDPTPHPATPQLTSRSTTLQLPTNLVRSPKLIDYTKCPRPQPHQAAIPPNPQPTHAKSTSPPKTSTSN